MIYLFYLFTLIFYFYLSISLASVLLCLHHFLFLFLFSFFILFILHFKILGAIFSFYFIFIFIFILVFSFYFVCTTALQQESRGRDLSKCSFQLVLLQNERRTSDNSHFVIKPIGKNTLRDLDPLILAEELSYQQNKIKI